jgi:hypothetical protein
MPASTRSARPSEHSSSLSAWTPYLIAMPAVCRYRNDLGYRFGWIRVTER